MNTSMVKWCIYAASTLLVGCAGTSDEEEPKPFGPTGIPPQLRGNSGGTPVTPGGNARPLPINITPQEDIIFTDPDNPDAGIPELESLMAAPKKGPWEESETIARQTAAREGKPILIWFTNSASSPMCRALSAELFSTNDFGSWATKNIVMLRVDSNINIDDKDLSLDDKVHRQTLVKNYVKRMKKRYRVLGHPTLLMLNPSGEVLWKDTGYKRGEADFTWGLLKQAKVASDQQYDSWRKGLEAKGYREWKGKTGRKVFAKLVSYSNGNMVLIEPGGERFRTNESKLSKNDRKWIDNQKALRGIQ
ncbi:MAG: thioredoxin fold domain-containing protein [Akkermansiaceae bacterium]